MNASTIRKLSLATTLIALFALSTDARAQARLPARMYFAELTSPDSHQVNSSRLNVIPASSVLADQELAQLALWLGGDSRAIGRAASITQDLRRRGAIRPDEQIVGLSNGQALKIRGGEVAALRAVTGVELVTGE